jgi:glycerol-3-phosphate dehydrogenase
MPQINSQNTNKPYDLTIIGGGIAGAGIARDAALRGARVLLLEKNTFGSGTSSRSSRLIHGGIRYLEIAWAALCAGDLRAAGQNFSFVFSALKECRTLEKIAPDLVRPISLLIPIYADDLRGPWTVYAGSYLYYLLALFSGGGRCPKVFHGAEAVLRLAPDLRRERLKGAIQIWDRTTHDQKLVEKTIASARRAGAECLEQAEVLGWERMGAKGDFKIQVRQADGEKIFESRVLVNAAGPWVDRVRGLTENNSARSLPPPLPLISPVAGAHITVKKFLDVSTLLQARDKRIFFCINTDDGCRIGTTERICHTPDRVEATENEINYLLKSLEFYFPEKNLTRADILSTDAGIRPLALPDKTISAHATSREHSITRDPSGIVNVVGVKLTDYRRAAEDTLSFILPDLLTHNPAISKKSITATTIL